MIRQDIDIAGYWKLIIIYDANLGYTDVGFTHTNFKTKTSIVGISPTSSQEQFFNTLVHEAKHVQSHICEYYEVEEDSEDAAYLIGYIIQKMHRVFKYLIKSSRFSNNATRLKSPEITHSFRVC